MAKPLQSGLYVNPKTNQMCIYQQKNTDVLRCVTHGPHMRTMVDEGFIYICGAQPSTLWDNGEFKFTNYRNRKIAPKEADDHKGVGIDAMLAYSEAISLGLSQMAAKGDKAHEEINAS